MGNNISMAAGPIPEPHLRIYKNILGIQSPVTRLQMLETLLAGQEYVATAKRTGIYGAILSYIVSIRRGDTALLPGEKGSSVQGQSGQSGQSGSLDDLRTNLLQAEVTPPSTPRQSPSSPNVSKS